MYRIVPDDQAVDQVEALPDDALPAFAEALAVLELTPGNGRPYNAELPDGPMRELVFGQDAQGTVTYLVLEEQREVHILLVQWLG
ncbi:hypothetical protein [Amycolatopsis aidingensis]|uniref:hypothetical protein n=1 Tax=Amycolatopsis aidingensis TaxID=2842453 RepID=UPI001C0C2EEE|nr:hypothetical protein [Amycolatopsis aidingensis]